MCKCTVCTLLYQEKVYTQVKGNSTSYQDYLFGCKKIDQYLFVSFAKHDDGEDLYRAAMYIFKTH